MVLRKRDGTRGRRGGDAVVLLADDVDGRRRAVGGAEGSAEAGVEILTRHQAEA